jgi:hypothetical protein
MDRINERLIRLKRRRLMADYDDDFLTLMIEDATRAFEDYCNRPDPGASADSIICEMATIMVNREGAEGSGSAEEGGGIKRTWEGGTLPEDILKRLKPFRLVKGLD